MGASQGRPYCKKGQTYLTTKDKIVNLQKSCRSCEHIEYVGCPGWKHNSRKNRENKTYWWIRWWYHNEPVPDTYHKKDYYETVKIGDPRGRGGI